MSSDGVFYLGVDELTADPEQPRKHFDQEELETLVEYNNSSKNATINKTFFPEAVPSWYWTASEHPQSENHAWYVLFQNGVALNDLKERPKHVRLVRGNRAQ